MKHYEIIIAPVASDKIAEYGRYIADSSGSQEIAVQWIDRVYDKIGTLNIFPYRHAIAQEDDFRDYEIRQQIIGNYLALYSVDEEEKSIYIIGFRHGQQLLRPGELPEILPEK